MKQLLQRSALALTFIAVMAFKGWAQEQVMPQMDSQSAVPEDKVQHRAIDVADNQMWYGYYKGTEPIVGMGVPSPGVINEMIYINADDPNISGKTIKAVRFRIQGTPDLSDFTVWLAPQMPYPASEGHIMTVDVDETELKDTLWNEVLLPEGYAVPDTGVYVGYSFYTAATTRQSTYPVMTTNDRIAPEGSMFDWEEAFMSGWQWYPGGQMGKLCIQVLLEGEFNQNAAILGDLGNHIVVAGESVEVPVDLTNNGMAGITDFDYQVYTNDVAGVEKHVVLPEPFTVFGGKTKTTVELDADPEYAWAEKKVKITKVNGQPNLQADVAGTGSLITLAKDSHRRALVEEYTGTWCGYCPRGTVGLRKLQEDFGDDVVAVSIHTDDPMAILGYQAIYENVRSYPSAHINRVLDVDPYAGSLRVPYGVKTDVEQQLALPTEATLDLEAQWSNDAFTRIAVTSKMRFQYNSADSPYAMAYVLVEDGLQCDTTGWEQANFYYYFKDYEEYQPGTQMYEDFKEYLSTDSDVMEGVVYDDVAVAAYGVSEGLPGSVKAPIVVDEEKTHSYTISVANNALIQDKSKLSVAAFIIDKTDGRVVNAAIVPVEGYELGIDDALTSNGNRAVSRYSIDGRRLTAPQRGLNIIRTADGCTMKVVVR